MITASIVLYNTKIEDLHSVIHSYCPSEERILFLIDNSEEELTFAKELAGEHIKYVHNNKNLGYGSAQNIGIKEAIDLESDYHIVLNPDISFEPDIINKLISYADENNDVVYILPKVIYPSGELQYLCKLLPTPFDLIFRRFLPSVGFIKAMNDRYILKESGYNRIINPPCLSGCFMFMRTKTLKDNGMLFDERFFMYCEDFDLMRRLHRVGKTIFYPDVTIIHNHAKGSYKSRKMLLMHISSACKYFNKYGWFFDKERKEMNKRLLDELYN